MTAPGTLLTARDLALLHDLYKYRYLSVTQLQRLHFPSLATTWRRLRALANAGYLTSFLAPHVPEHLYYLAPKGAGVVADALGVAVRDLVGVVPQKKPQDYYFLRHFLQITDFRLALRAACQPSSLALLGFIPEYFGTKTSAGGIRKYIQAVLTDTQAPGEKLSHTPDGVFALARGTEAALFFLEMDRGTEVISAADKGVLKALRFYLRYLVSGEYQRYQADFSCTPFKGFRTLFVTTSEQRITHIRQALRSVAAPAKAKQFIWLTEAHRVQAHALLQPIWVSADADDNHLYQLG